MLHLQKETVNQYIIVFWSKRYHLNLYPHALALSPSLVKELKDIVLFFVGGLSD